jgi:ribonuclease E/ribonuclease G
MTVELLIDDGIAETRAALFRDGRLDDLRIERTLAPSLVGNVYAGRVRRVAAGLGLAFVDIGTEREGVLRAHDARFARGAEPARSSRINALVAEGDTVLVQVAAAARGDKGPRLTTAIAPAGIDDCTADWREAARAARAPALLQAEAAPLEAALRDLATPEVRAIRIGTLAGEARARRYCDRHVPRAGGAIERATPFAVARAIDAEIAEALAPEVALAGGARLTIETTRALTAIDVDSGSYAGASGADTARTVNLAAAAEIARQLRIRNIGGTIVVDFIKFKDRAGSAGVTRALKRALGRDRMEVRVGAVSRSGLLEMARRRDRPSLAELMLEPTAPQATADARAAAALRAAERTAAAHPGQALAILAPLAVARILRTADARLLRALGERIGQPVAIEAIAGAAGDDARVRVG